MNLSAVYHRSALNYCYALNENEISISIMTGYDIEKITLFYNDPFISGIMGSQNSFEGNAIEIKEFKELKNSLIWHIVIKPEYKRLAYYFLLESTNENGDLEQYYYFEDNFYTPTEYINNTSRKQYFFMPWINKADIISTPSWVNKTVWYQIFVERFFNGDSSINLPSTKPWRSPDQKVHYSDFFGGDIPGITQKLDYLKNLGITGIYLTPICKSKSNHKYDTEDFSVIDPHFGTTQDMKNMVEKAHTHGIRVMMDGVFNHTGVLFKPWKDVVANGPSSIYYDWFIINKWPFETGRGADNAVHKNYYTFGFYDDMPKLNTNNPEVIDYIVSICKNWIQEYNIDGLRLDVAGEISHKLCKALHNNLKAIKHDFYILGELWHDSIPWLMGDEFDSVMNYPFADSVNDFWSNTNMTSKDFEFSINRCYTLYPKQVNNVLFNLFDSHDTIRLVTKLKSIDKFYQQLGVLFTMPGSVCIFYGTEVGLEGSYDPDCRRCMPFDEIESGIYDERINKIKSLIKNRKTLAAFSNDNIKFSYNYNNPRVISYTKYGTIDNDINVILNCSKNTLTIKEHISNILFSNLYNETSLQPNGILIYN